MGHRHKLKSLKTALNLHTLQWFQSSTQGVILFPGTLPYTGYLVPTCSSRNLSSGQVEAIKVHDFIPRRYKVVQELLLRILASIDFRYGPQL